MKRREFLTTTFTSSAGILILPHFGGNIPNERIGSVLVDNFITPPAAARPYTYWMWMNGNITSEGITLDLEAMARGGIGGAYIYNNAVGIPRGPVDYNSDAWKDMLLHAVKEAARLDIVLSIHNSPGYSGTGGPWITPDLSMQELVWTETYISGGQVSTDLPRPYAKQEYYRDAAILAYPTLPGEKVPLLAKAWADGKEIAPELVTGIDLDKKFRIEPGGPEQPASLLLQFTEPFTARAITLRRHPETPKDLYDGPRDYPPTFRLECSDDGTNFRSIGTLHCPALRAMDAPAAESFAPVTSAWFRLVTDSPTYIARVELHGGPRLKDWPAKTNYTGGNTMSVSLNPGYDDSLAIDSGKVINVTGKLVGDHLDWAAPEGAWTILRIGHTTTGEVVGAAPDSAIGLECDKFSKEAVDYHFKVFLDPLLDRLGTSVGKTLTSILIDSWEAGKQNWSVVFPDEFRRRRSYDLLPLLAALTGRIVDTLEKTEGFLRDVRQTHADLVAENYYGHFATLCHARHLELHGEPYGDGTFDSLQSGSHLDQPMGEFWTRYIYGDAMTSRQAVSLAHVYGRRIAASEAFTGMPITSRWTEYPYSLKAEADWFFTLGLNRLVFHTFVHQPHTTGFPGMTMGPFGTHFDRNSTWTRQLSAWTLYLARVQSLLQQGRAVVDIAYLKEGEPSSGIPERGRIRPAIPLGYGLDVIGVGALQNIRIVDGEIVFPTGMTYRLLMVQSRARLSAGVLARIDALVAEGMTLVVNDRDFESVAPGVRLTPDFTYTATNPAAAIHFVHKKIDDADVYFISNHLRRRETIVASVRISGRVPELWDAQTGETREMDAYTMQDNRTMLSFELEPAGSLFIIFRRRITSAPHIPALQPFASGSARYPDDKNDFTMLVWIKPDTFAHRGKGFLIHAPEGEVLYGAGHAATGLAAGQNTIRLYERSKGAAREVLSVDRNIEGYTAIAIVYQEGHPTLYIDGVIAKVGIASGLIVHPGLGAVATEDQFQSYFEGNSTEPQLYAEAWRQEKITEWYGRGLPDPELPAGSTATVIHGPWELQFPAGTGAPATFSLAQLISLHTHSDPGVKYFSGTVSYHKTITIPAHGHAKKLFLDLGRVEVLAEIIIDGKSIGTVWKEPYRIEISQAIKPGPAHLEIRVTTLWPNRLIGDENLPPENEYSPYGPITKLPDWYIRNQSKPGERTTFDVWHSYSKTDPLLASGLLGPVRLFTIAKKASL